MLYVKKGIFYPTGTLPEKEMDLIYAFLGGEVLYLFSWDGELLTLSVENSLQRYGQTDIILL